MHDDWGEDPNEEERDAMKFLMFGLVLLLWLVVISAVFFLAVGAFIVDDHWWSGIGFMVAMLMMIEFARLAVRYGRS